MSKALAKHCEKCDFTIVQSSYPEWEFCPYCGTKLETKQEIYLD